MDYFIPPISIINLTKDSNIYNSGNIDPKTVATQFSSIFINTLFKDVLKGQAEGFFSDDGKIKSPFSNDFMQHMVDHLAQEDIFGFGKLLDPLIEKNIALKMLNYDKDVM